MAAEAATPGARTRWLTLAAMTLANSMILVDQTAVPLAVPELIQDLGGNLDEGPLDPDREHPAPCVHAVAYEVTFISAGGIALLGALACFILVRKTDRVEAGPIFSRRSRWLYTMSGRSPAITKQPDPGGRG